MPPEPGPETVRIRAHRRLRLPADHRSPAAARAAVREVLLAGGWADLLDEALLLVSELSTNGVVHAGTSFDVDVLADADGVTVSVSDQKAGLVGSASSGRSGPFELTAPGPRGRASAAPTDDPEAVLEAWDEGETLQERGRGLLLVDQLASSWGTSHHAMGKSVWFRLGPPGPVADPVVPVARVGAAGPSGWAGPATPEVPASSPGVDGEAGVTPSACVWLVHVPDGLRSRLSMPQLVSELLARLCEVTGAAAGAVWLDRGDGAGERRIAWHENPDAAVPGPPPARAEETRAPEGDGSTVVATLPVTHPLRGCVVLQSAAGGAAGRHWGELATLSAHRMAIGVDTDRVHRDDQRRRGWLAFLAEASELLANSLDVELTLALVPQIVVPRLGDWCAVHVVDGPAAELRLATVGASEETRVPDLQRLLGGGAGAAAGLSARLADLVVDEETIALSGEVEGVAVPLSARGRVLGTLSVGRHPDRLHAADDISVISDLARRASVALDNARAHNERAQVAQDLQRALLPQALPVTPGLEFGAEYVPASTGAEVGGDFYDVVHIRRNRWLVSIGDVCGKGAAAAAVTGVVRDVVRALVGDNRSLPRTLRALNRTLLRQQTGDKHCTLAVALVSRREQAGPTGEMERALDVRLCLAGHDRPVLLHADGTASSVGEWGTAVGLCDEIEVNEVGVTMRPGDSLVFYTDGVTERRHGSQMFGTGRLRRELEPLAGHSAPAIAARVREAVLKYSAQPPRDDIAVLVLRNPD